MHSTYQFDWLLTKIAQTIQLKVNNSPGKSDIAKRK
jgi:hypothetical protein